MEQQREKAWGAKRREDVAHHDSWIIEHILWFGMLVVLLLLGYLDVLDITSPKHNVIELLL